MEDMMAANMSSQQQHDPFGENDDISPFRPPNDEEVFVTRETEK